MKKIMIFIIIVLLIGYDLGIVRYKLVNYMEMK